MNARYMRIFVLFDLPTKEKIERKRYMKFRKFLINDGYDMIQYSIYSRFCKGIEGVDKHLDRLQNNLPPDGHIRSLVVTDRQFGNMKLLLGEKTAQEERISCEHLTLF